MEHYDKAVPKFSLGFHGSLSHDDINLVEVADRDTAEHLRKLSESGFLDNALVIVMADHGHRFAKFRNTHQGRLKTGHFYIFQSRPSESKPLAPCITVAGGPGRWF